MKRKDHPNVERVECLSNLPLHQFKPGQRLYVKWSLGGGHYACAMAEFERLERGIVCVKLVKDDYLSPDYMDWHGVEQDFPDLRMRVRAKSIYLWGQRREDKWCRCYWFQNTKTPAT